jgi:hypothetical protein
MKKKTYAAIIWFKEKPGYRKFKKEALDGAVWRTRFGRGYGATVRQTTVI